MSYTSIPNQPIIFDSQLPEQCEGCNKDYAQLMDFNDQVFWQLEAGECGYLRLVDTIVVSTSIDGNEVTFPDSAGGNLAGFVYAKFQNCLDYRVTITINQGATGTLVVAFTNGTFVEISAVGTHVIYLKANAIPANLNSPTIDLLLIAKPTDEFVGVVTLDEFVPICNGALFAGIVDAQDLSVVQVLDPTIITKDQYLTAAIDLSDYELEAGCYRLAIADYCTNTCGQYYIYNPFFNDWGLCIGCPPLGWDNDISNIDNWNIANSQADISLSVGGFGRLISITEMCEGKEYSVTIVVDSMSDARLRIEVDGVNLYTINSAGTYTFNIIPTSSGNFSLYGFEIGGGTGGSIVVSRVDARAFKEWATYDKYSDLITIGDYSDPCRFFKIEGCNGEDQFGLSFYGSSFLPSIRLEGRRFKAQYETDADLFRYSSGRWSSTYVDRKKKVSFYFGRLPEYVFDFLSIVFFFDNCYINGVLHSPVDSEFPTIEYDDADDLGAVTIELFKQNDLVKKTICIGVTADCLPSILDNQDEPFLLTQDNERILTENLINLYQE